MLSLMLSQNKTNIVNSTTGTITFRLKDTKSKKESPIIFDYSFGRGNRIKYSTGFKITPKNWDHNNQRIRAVSTIKNREEVNNKLLEIKSDFLKAVSRLSKSDQQKKTVLKTIYNNVIGREKKDNITNINFFKYCENFINSHKSNNTAKITKLSDVTIRSYKQTINKLKKFNTSTSYSLDFEKFDIEFYHSFIDFLEKSNYSTNTIGKHIKNTIALLNRATEDGVNKNLKYKHRDFKRISEKTTSIYLSKNEIDTIYDLDLSNTPNWERARDIFIIGYYTGQRVSDYNGLTKKNIKTFNGKEVFEIHQKKTNKTVYIPIHKKIKAIMNKSYSGGLPEKMSDQKINKFIKKVCQKAKINEKIITKITLGGKIIEKSVPKYDLVGTHTARRSFCSNAYLSKMPVIDIMTLSGHVTEKEFYNYIKVTPQERAVKIADSPFFNN